MIIKRLAAIGAAGALALALAACGSSTPAASSSSTSPSSAASSSAASSDMSSSAMTSGAMTSGDMTSGAMTSGAMTSGAMTSGSAMAGTMVGTGCAAYAAANPSGAGSVSGMAADPVATAASNNPLLTTLVAAVSGKLNPKVNLVNTLNSGDFTVFAPVDDAFKKIDAATIDKLKTDDALLTKILTYHVVAGQLDPSQIVGTHKTVEGEDLTVSGSGDNLKVNGASTVICGGVKTKNATVYLIDTVLMPGAGSGSTASSAMTSAASMGMVGAGCADYAKANPSGAGSVSGMAQDPVATAASNNPLLKTLVAAVSGKVNPKVNLVNTLNSGEFTVFAPVDSAFAKVDAATMTKLTTDATLLSKILTYHVIAGQLDPSKIVGTHKTVEGASVTVTGSGDNLKVAKATVICGGVKTKNATVYLIDSVLTPAS